jgi:hypothetical protein
MHHPSGLAQKQTLGRSDKMSIGGADSCPCTHTHIHIHADMQTYIIYIYVYMYVCMHACRYVYSKDTYQTVQKPQDKVIPVPWVQVHHSFVPPHRLAHHQPHSEYWRPYSHPFV